MKSPAGIVNHHETSLSARNMKLSVPRKKESLSLAVGQKTRNRAKPSPASQPFWIFNARAHLAFRIAVPFLFGLCEEAAEGSQRSPR